MGVVLSALERVLVDDEEKDDDGYTDEPDEDEGDISTIKDVKSHISKNGSLPWMINERPIRLTSWNDSNRTFIGENPKESRGKVVIPFEMLFPKTSEEDLTRSESSTELTTSLKRTHC